MLPLPLLRQRLLLPLWGRWKACAHHKQLEETFGDLLHILDHTHHDREVNAVRLTQTIRRDSPFETRRNAIRPANLRVDRLITCSVANYADPTRSVLSVGHKPDAVNKWDYYLRTGMRGLGASGAHCDDKALLYFCRWGCGRRIDQGGRVRRSTPDIRIAHTWRE